MSNSDDLNMNYLFGSVQICKVLFILNYGLKFFIYCATGSYFRNQLNQIKTKSIYKLTFYHRCIKINYFSFSSDNSNGNNKSKGCTTRQVEFYFEPILNKNKILNNF